MLRVGDLDVIIAKKLDLVSAYRFLLLEDSLSEEIAKEVVLWTLKLKNVHVLSYIEILEKINEFSKYDNVPMFRWLLDMEEIDLFISLFDRYNLNETNRTNIYAMVFRYRSDYIVAFLMNKDKDLAEELAYSDSLVSILLQEDYVYPLELIIAVNIRYSLAYSMFDRVSKYLINHPSPSFDIIEFLINNGYNESSGYYTDLYRVLFSYRKEYSDEFSNMQLHIEMETLDFKEIIPEILEDKSGEFLDPFEIDEIQHVLGVLLIRYGLINEQWFIDYIRQRNEEK